MGLGFARYVFMAMTLLVTACGAPLYTANLAGVSVEILPQEEVQRRCSEKGLRVSSPLFLQTLGCAYQDSKGSPHIYSIDSAGTLLHELDHAFNKKWCHSPDGAPAYCATSGRASP